MAYQVDCLFAAVSVLAGHGHIKQRLISAYEEHVDMLGEEDLPIVAREAFADLRDKMYRVAPLNGEGPVCASVRKMSVEEASACAVSIVELCHEVARLESEVQAPPPAIDSDVVDPVPPFLVKAN